MDGLKLQISRAYARNFNRFFKAVLVIQLLANVATDYLGVNHVLMRVLSIHSESSTHNWLSSFVLGLVGLLAFVVAGNAKASGNRGLSVGFQLFGLMTMGMAIDEEATIHEAVGATYHDLTTSGVLPLKSGWWLTAYSPLIVVSVAFLFHLSRKVRKAFPRAWPWFLWGSCIWVIALGFEFLDGRFKQRLGTGYRWQAVVRYVSEYAEVIGSYFFLVVMVRCLETQTTGREGPKGPSRLAESAAVIRAD